jgi:cardiolipin synthase
MFLNLPTLLTWARIVAIPLIVGVFYLPWPPHQLNLLASVLFVVVALTDWADGWLAGLRRLSGSSG